MLDHVARISHPAVQHWQLVTAAVCSMKNPIRCVSRTGQATQNAIYRQVTNSDYLNVLKTIIMGKSVNL
jgi:hypothetical protein